ncbi:uncharacterized protein LOC124141095 isoform X2 [Haliotis rufescens]|uniref:uncharacterized protein LOC124141095 isoform X2 n=1 Tax=Haliotis rufescens TaxID=6454 RepID=UPI001EB08537|nr:uncharacterized protein LOC124141095 isoform X2 [Haliotis rufescens]XP_046364952.1 uncharacterized protein LOC124141095 isoform X2 [Haliotis rufescens]
MEQNTMDQMEICCESGNIPQSPKAVSDYGLRATLRKSVVDILGNLEESVISEIVQELEKLGVVTIQDLEWIHEDDLKGNIRPVHARKLLRRSLMQSSTRISAVPGSSCSSMSPLSPTSPSSSDSSMKFSPKSPKPIMYSNRDPNWPVKMELPWDDLNCLTKEALVQGKRLTPDAKKEVVHKVVDVVRRNTHHALRPQFSIIAQRMVAKYTQSLQDKIDDSVVGSGYDTLLNKLVTRNQNLNRGSSKFCMSGKKRPMQNTETESGSDDSRNEVKTRRDSYGCVKWMPELKGDKVKVMEEIRDALIEMNQCNSDKKDVNKIEENMLSCYALQRRDINSGMSVVDLKLSWPFLFSIQGVLCHSQELLGFNVRSALGNAYAKKGPRLNNFFRKSSDGNEFIFDEARRQSSQDNLKAWLSAVVLCIMGHLGEKDEELFYVVDETSTAAEVQASSKTDSPVLVVLGDSVLAGKSYMVMCDRQILIPRCHSFMDSFSALFASYYIFNLQYQTGAAATLEFIQSPPGPKVMAAILKMLKRSSSKLLGR